MPQDAFCSQRLCKRFSIDCFVKTTNCLENLPQHLQYIYTFEPHDTTNIVVCAPSEDSDQPGHPPCLIWESSLSARRKSGSLATHFVHSEDSDQTGRMPRLNRVFAGRTVIFLVLSWGGSFFPQKLTIREVLCSSFKLLSSCFYKCCSNIVYNCIRKNLSRTEYSFFVEY